MNRTLKFALPLTAAALLAACGTTGNQKQASGAGAGAIAGAVVAGPVGAVVGAGVGAAAGVVKNQSDKTPR